ncbi:hypothetical protein BD769DRAFT_1665010 [Suillus cothurnatus]|nr:hypothetical protein BD769DRAFT_1665010 [Suillus cothurnatus]
MTKRAASIDDQHTPKHVRITKGTCLAAPSPKTDEGTWRILETFLMTDTTYPQTEEAFKDALAVLFSGDGDDTIALANLRTLKAVCIPKASAVSSNSTNTAKDSNLVTSALKRNRRSCRPFNPYINDQAEVDDDSEEEEEECRLFNCFIDDQAREPNEDDDGEAEDRNGSSMKAPNVMSMPGPSAKNRLAAVIDDIIGRYQEEPGNSSRGRLPYKAAWSPGTIENRMYLLLVHRNATQYIAEHLQSKGFSATVSTWIPGQLYVVLDSPKMISASLPPSHNLSVREYLRIKEEEHEAVEHANVKLPNLSWVRIKHGKYKGAIAYVFDSKQSSFFVKVLVPPRDFPYPMPRGSVTLLDSSHLPRDNTVTDIIYDEELVGCSYKGSKYHKGLLLKDCHRYLLEYVSSPHVDDIRLHLQSGWDTLFMKQMIVAFSMQFLHTGDVVRVIKGGVHSEIGTVLSIDYTLGSACLELTFDGDKVKMEVRLQDLERVFCIGDTVRVVAGAYLGLEGHVIQVSGDIFHLCQDISKEEVQVSKYYLDHRPIDHMFQPQLSATQQPYEPPIDESIQVGDHIEVLLGEHLGKCGIVSWFPAGVTQLWFHDANPIFIEDEIKHSLGPPILQVATAFVRRTHLAQTITYTKEKGYDVRPRDVVSVARGPEYQAKGVVQSVDLPKARLRLLSENDQSLIDVPIGFVVKLCNAPLDSFRKVINNEVFLIGGDRKGFRATLYSIGTENCVIAVHGQACITVKCQDVVTRYGMRLNEGLSLSVAPSSSTFDPWTVDAQDTQDNINARAEKVQDNGPLPWLMSKEFASQLLTYHALLKVSLKFNGGGGKLHRRCVSTACPDPFCGVNGPAPEGFVAVFCASSNKGATLQHYHIPAGDLCPAPPRRKNQLCLILDGEFHGQIRTVSKCNVKLSTAELVVGDSDAPSITLRFDQICLVERFMMS